MTAGQVDYIEAVLLGIGGAFDADHGVPNSNLLLEIHAGEAVQRVLIDCGHTCGRQLNRLGLSYRNIDAVLITHSHGDHIDGLEILGYKSIFLHQRTVPVFSTPGILDLAWASLRPKMGSLQLARDHSVDASMATYFDPRPVGNSHGGRTEIVDGVEAEFISVSHVAGMPAFAVLLYLPWEERPVLRWSGDKVFDPHSRLFDDLAPSHRVFHDSMFLPHYPATVHTHLESLAGLEEGVRRQLVLVHHGKVAESGTRIDGMLLGQEFDRYRFDPK